jgi:Protein of unknown function (DUF1353)
MNNNVTRRVLTRSALSALILPSISLGQSTSTSELGAGEGDPEKADRWMLDWINRENASSPGTEKKAPFGALHIGRFADRMYYTTSLVGWEPSPLQGHLPTVRVPPGFVTDLTSIPRIFWSLIDPSGNYSHAAVIHDYLYWEQFTDRSTADLVFKLHMEDLAVNVITVQAIYSAVVLAGQKAWESNKKAKQNGERRQLKNWPKDPKTEWVHWKVDPKAFT